VGKPQKSDTALLRSLTSAHSVNLNKYEKSFFQYWLYTKRRGFIALVAKKKVCWKCGGNGCQACEGSGKIYVTYGTEYIEVKEGTAKVADAGRRKASKRKK